MDRRIAQAEQSIRHTVLAALRRQRVMRSLHRLDGTAGELSTDQKDELQRLIRQDERVVTVGLAALSGPTDLAGRAKRISEFLLAMHAFRDDGTRHDECGREA